MKYGSQKYMSCAKWIYVHDFYEHMNSVYPEFLFISKRIKKFFTLTLNGNLKSKYILHI